MTDEPPAGATAPEGAATQGGPAPEGAATQGGPAPEGAATQGGPAPEGAATQGGPAPERAPGAPPPAAPAGGAARIESFLGSRKAIVLLYLCFAGAYLGAAGLRVRRHSEYNHFVYLAEGWLHGRLALAGSPPNENDWAKVEVLHLKDGRTLRGKFSKTGIVDRFYALSGSFENVDEAQIASREAIRYVSFPPFPAVVMLPFVAAFGLGFNDVLFTVLWAAANPVLLFLLLRALRRRDLSQRTAVDDLWLATMFGAGSVYYYASVLGQVWYTAHVVGVTLVLGYVWASLDAARPALAGLLLGLGSATRTPLGFMLPFFLLEAVRASGGWAALGSALRRARLPAGLVPRLWRFGLPAAAVVALLLFHNHARFERFTEFGHKYLTVQWNERIDRWGLFNYHFLSRNLTALLVLLPRIMTRHPFVKMSDHGMSIFLTSPWLGYVFAPRRRSRLAPGLWLSIAAVALPSLLYQNSGYIQFGYRFALDYMVFLVVLLAVGMRPITWMWKALAVFAVAVNLFGAITFDRMREFYYDDTFFPHGNN